METFGGRLRAAVADRGPLCVGIDPHPELLAGWGLPDTPVGVRAFSRKVTEALADRVAVLKPQVAFFERFGSRGFAVLEDVIDAIRAAGALVLLDVKRGDVASTTHGYAAAYLRPDSPLPADAVTASPYLGVGALSPMLESARAHGGGVFVLALTSNPEAAAVQRARTAGGGPVAQLVVDEIAQVNGGTAEDGRASDGSFGVVVGATVGTAGLDLSRLGGPILAPGLGLQGATAADLRARFGADLAAVLPSYARSVLAAGPDRAALRQAAERALTECRAALAV